MKILLLLLVGCSTGSYHPLEFQHAMDVSEKYCGKDNVKYISISKPFDSLEIYSKCKDGTEVEVSVPRGSNPAYKMVNGTNYEVK